MVITALEVLETTSDAITAVPFLGAIVSAVLGLAKTLEVRHRCFSSPKTSSH